MSMTYVYVIDIVILFNVIDIVILFTSNEVYYFDHEYLPSGLPPFCLYI
jgi:hypothetical protein